MAISGTNNMPTFTHQGKELTAGQALDVWLVLMTTPEYLVNDIHYFAEAVYGHPAAVERAKLAGIEIQFGEKSS
jgi:hypothetical protein